MKFHLLAGAALLVTANIAAARDITIAQSSDLRSSNPGVNRDGNTDGVILHIVEGLVRDRASETNPTSGALAAKAFVPACNRLIVGHRFA